MVEARDDQVVGLFEPRLSSPRGPHPDRSPLEVAQSDGDRVLMGSQHAVIGAHQRREADTLRRAEREIDSRAMGSTTALVEVDPVGKSTFEELAKDIAIDGAFEAEPSRAFAPPRRGRELLAIDVVVISFVVDRGL